LPFTLAFEDLRLLVKLSYTPSYTSLDSTPLDNHTLTRLLVLADRCLAQAHSRLHSSHASSDAVYLVMPAWVCPSSFEFVHCATACAEKLVAGLGYNDAVRCFQVRFVVQR
jgi:hypothetical protein